MSLSSSVLSPLEKECVSVIRDAVEKNWNWSCSPFARSSAAELDLDGVDEDFQFLEQFDDLEMKSESKTLASHEAHLEDLKLYQSQYNKMLGLLESTGDSLKSFMEVYHQVAHKTSSLHETCEQLMADQTHFASSAEEIRVRLSYFEHIEQITHKLSSPMLSVSGETFAQILNTIDQSMAFLQENSGYKESALHLHKYQQCLSKSLGLVKTHVCMVLRNAVVNVQAKDSQTKTGVAQDDAFTLYYGVFASQSPGIHSMMEQLESRWDLNEEYQLMASDCYRFYFAQREQLILPSVQVSLQELVKQHQGNVCGLVRSACGFLSRLCEDEQTLFYRFFTRPTPLFAEFVERISDVLYDTARPLIIHIQHLETLAELCAILKVETLEGRSLNDLMEPEYFTSEAAYGFARSVRKVLGEVSERLVYRAQLYAKNDIAGYSPAPGDLAYPEKLEMMLDIAAKMSQSEKGHSREKSLESVGSNVSQEVANITAAESGGINFSPADLHGFWYPPVRRTVMCLSKLYKCLDTTIFQGLAQDVLAMCIQALLAAHQSLEKSKGFLDAQLFLIKHLLIIREQIVPFRIEDAMLLKDTSLDFGKMRDAANSLMQHRRRLLSLANNALLEFLLSVSSQTTEQIVDSRRDLDLELKRSCQTFIAHLTAQLSCQNQLGDFVQKAEAIVAERSKDPTIQPLDKQPFAAADKVRDVTNRCYVHLKTNLPIVLKKLSIYIANKETEKILLIPVIKNIKGLYKRLSDLVASQYSEEQQQIIGCPSVEEINILLSQFS